MSGLRLDLIGMSDAPALLSIDRWRGPTAIYNRIKHGISPPAPPWLEQAGALGSALELGVAREGLRWKLGIDPDRVTVSKPPSRPNPGGVPHLRYSLDPICGVGFRRTGKPKPGSGPTVVTEVKVRPERSWAAQGWGEDGTADVAPGVWAQVQGQLACIQLDRDYWRGTDVPELGGVEVLVAVDGQRLYRYPVPVDPDAGHALLELFEKFWRDHIEAGIPPEIDGTEDTKRYLAERYASHTPHVREAGAEEAELVRMYLALKEERDKIAGSMSEIENKLTARIGHDRGIKGKGWRCYWSETRGRVDHRSVAEALAKRLKLSKTELDQSREFHRGKPYRRFDLRRTQ